MVTLLRPLLTSIQIIQAHIEMMSQPNQLYPKIKFTFVNEWQSKNPIRIDGQLNRLRPARMEHGAELARRDEWE